MATKEEMYWGRNFCIVTFKTHSIDGQAAGECMTKNIWRSLEAG